ncbi:pentapeptide repeat-containing protein [Arthrobacter sp.]|uniref:pentapeptide repeat-containing protein n=1 Tax=Arthrobacter sp. TaxID=1667 RepID=UPI00339A3D61
MSFVGAKLDGRCLAGVSFTECTFQDVSVDGADQRSAGFVDVAIERLNAPVFSAEYVEFRNCKLGYVNLRGAELQDVLFTGCILDELDLGGAAAHRLAFADSRVRRLDLTAAKLKHVDLRGLEFQELAGLEGLRGAAMTPFQIGELAALFAAHFDIVEKT